ncbi:OmpW family outer membrane protein [Vibrio salinus]|uniref:OmpW family outer membrane protein n=1 Tax=Vibrio salinus TaxID=2899784 RepID=UPI001E2CB5E0|nr:OmpW family outer membrane protein [Vibrio salinus]MCE0492499.1 hypothetical protein [Vibrio salinus]
MKKIPYMISLVFVTSKYAFGSAGINRIDHYTVTSHVNHNSVVAQYHFQHYSYSITPYTGVGYSSNAENHYEEEDLDQDLFFSTYIPVGIEIEKYIHNSAWKINLKYEYNLLTSSAIYASSGPSDGNRTQLALSFIHTPVWGPFSQVAITPYYQYQQFDNIDDLPDAGNLIEYGISIHARF